MKTSEVIGTIHWQELFASTLLHSLWQGAVVVLCMWILRLFYRNNPKVLYFLSLSALVTIVVLSIGSFIILMYAPAIELFSFGAILPDIQQLIIYKYINQVWLVGCIIFSLRFCWSHLFIRRLIQVSEPLSNERWYLAFQKVQQHYKIHRDIVLLQSEKIGSAFLTGVIKPIILIPTAWINQLSEKEAECILAHELSHALNKDHWVNLMMNIFEIIYFFNPAVHILLSHLKLERELLADASASSYINSRMEYAKLILKIEESSGLIPAFSLPFFRQKKQLRKRIETVLNISNGKSEMYSGFAIMIILSALAFIKMNPLPLASVCLPDHVTEHFQSAALCPVRSEVLEPILKPSPVLPAQVTKRNVVKKRVYKYESLNINQEVVFENISTDEFFPELEKTIRKELGQRTNVVLQLKHNSTESIQTLDGNSWIVTKQIRCYAPEDERTIIIVRMNKNAEHPIAPELDRIDPETIELEHSQIN